MCAEYVRAMGGEEWVGGGGGGEGGGGVGWGGVGGVGGGGVGGGGLGLYHFEGAPVCGAVVCVQVYILLLVSCG